MLCEVFRAFLPPLGAATAAAAPPEDAASSAEVALGAAALEPLLREEHAAIACMAADLAADEVPPNPQAYMHSPPMRLLRFILL